MIAATAATSTEARPGRVMAAIAHSGLRKSSEPVEARLFRA